jgi:hypothetical protein
VVDTILFGPNFTEIIPVNSTFKILVNLGVATPAPIFVAAAPGDLVPTNMRLIDFDVWNNGLVQAGATATLQSSIGAGGLVALSSVLDISVQDSKIRTLTMDNAQSDLTAANPAGADTLSVAKNAAGDRGIGTVLAYLL